MVKYTDFEIPVVVAGVRFRNPFYVSSGPTTMTIEQLEKIQEYGWAGASLKLTIDPEPYINRYPRYGYYPEKTFLTFTAERRLTLAQLEELIKQGRQRTPDIILMSNITYAGDKGPEGWANMARRCEAAGAHANELNMCCPNMSFNVELTGHIHGGPRTGASMGKDEKSVAEIVAAIKAVTKIPLFVKITPEGGSQSKIAKAALAAGADAVGGNANRLGVPPINIYNPTKSQYFLQDEIGMACMNGPWLRPLALRDVYEMRKMCGPQAFLTATGGVTEWKDAVEMFLCGADLVGICTATLVNGFGFMPEFLHGFKEFLRSKGYQHPREMRDQLVPAITSAPDLTIYEGHARKKQAGLTAPCTFACPNSVPAMGYVRRVADEEFEQAYQLILSKSPLQSICGKICDHPCEGECTRGLMDEPIMIRAIKRFVLEMGEREGWKPQILSAVSPAKKGKKVAVVGSGPAGLACAYDLARAGYAVTVFEASDKLGGMLTSCIPAFRLGEADVKKEIDAIRSLGVEFQTGKAFGKDVSLAGLRKVGYDAVFLGLGAQVGQRLGIPGEDLAGCLNAVDFLRSVSEKWGQEKWGQTPLFGGRKMGSVPTFPTGRVAVVGGGFTAIDAARTALRLGVSEVFILYRRTRDEMPASADEIREAEEEGVKIMYLVAPQEILSGEGSVEGVSPSIASSSVSSSSSSSSSGAGKVTKIRMLNYVLGEADASNRRRPVEVPGTEFTLDVDTVIAAVSQGVRVEAGQDLALTRWGAIAAEEDTGATNVAGVYAGGDCTRGPSSVIQAVADGKRAAVSIDRYLSGDAALLVYDGEKTPSDKDRVLQRVAARARQWRPKLETVGTGSVPLGRCLSPLSVSPLSEAGEAGDWLRPSGTVPVPSFLEGNEKKKQGTKKQGTGTVFATKTEPVPDHAPTLTQAQAVEEAKRCLACGCGVGCEVCSSICKMFAWTIDAQGCAVLDEDKCVACGMCIWRCPNQNVEMVQTGTRNLVK
jgi:NADPH-dependent glutamate synthase beta subunit-like oxidoreductase/dihydroorotate dehydrogenase/ferredoxin